MLEIVDKDNNVKMVAFIICGIKYGDSMYVIYSLKRDSNDDNIFVSRVEKNSDGYVMDDDFVGGEKEAIDGVVANIINKISSEELDNRGIRIIRDIKLAGINKFSISDCYVTTYRRSLIKEVMVNYGLLDLNNDKKVIVSEKNISSFSSGSVLSVFLVGLGVFILVFCIGILIEIYIK